MLHAKRHTHTAGNSVAEGSGTSAKTWQKIADVMRQLEDFQMPFP